jgi:tRNA(Ser,Leu) C12 N-acetylase TAN1
VLELILHSVSVELRVKRLESEIKKVMRRINALSDREWIVPCAVERRGHKGEIDCRRIEKDLAAVLVESLTQRSCNPHVEFHDPDAILVIEIVRDECGIGLITRSMREQYPFVKVP